MAKRKSLNRKLARYSRSSVGSAVLDPDMDIIDDDRAYWWKELDNNTARYSMRSKVFDETSRHLNSASNIDDVEEEIEVGGDKEWWKALDESRSGSILKVRMNRVEDEQPRTEAENKAVELSASESEEEIRTKKRKLALREVATRKSLGENAFSMALHSSKESIASEPVSRRTLVESRKDSIFSDSAIPSGKARTSTEKVRSKGQQEDSGNQSRTMTEIVKPRPRVFGRRENQDRNVFQDVLLDNTPESPFKVPSKSPLRAKHARTPTVSENPRRSVQNDTPVAYQKRLSRFDLSFDTDSEKSLNLSVPKAQSTVIEPTTPLRRKPSDSESESELLKPKSRMLRRLRNSLGKNAFDEIIMESANEHSERETDANRTAPKGGRSLANVSSSGANSGTTKAQDRTEEEHSYKRSFRQTELDRSKKEARAESALSRNQTKEEHSYKRSFRETELDRSKKEARAESALSRNQTEQEHSYKRSFRQTELDRSKKEARAESALSRRSSDISSSPSRTTEELSTTDDEGLKDTGRTLTDTRAKMVPDSSSGDKRGSKGNQVEQVAISDTGVSATSESSIEIARARSPSAESEIDKDEFARSKKQNEMLISKLRKEIEGSANYPVSDNGSDQIVLRYSEEDNSDSEPLVTSRQKRSNQRPGLQETKKSSVRFSDMEEVAVTAVDSERSGPVTEKRARSREKREEVADVDVDSEAEGTNVRSMDEDARNSSRRSDASVRGRESSARERSKRSTLSKEADESSTRNDQIPVIMSKSVLGNKSGRAPLSTIWDDEVEEESSVDEEEDQSGRSRSRSHGATLNRVSDDERATEGNVKFLNTSRQSTASIASKRSILDNRAKRSTLIKSTHVLAEESTVRDEEPLNTSRQSAASIANKRSTFENRAKRSTLIKSTHDLAEENTERDEELPNTSRQSAASIASKRSTLGSRTMRSTLAKTRDELIEERDEEPLNISRQSAASIASKRSTLGNRTTRSTLAKTRDELTEESTEKDEEPLNTSRQSAASIASKRSTLGNRTKQSTLIKSSHELAEESTEKDEEPLNSSRQSAASIASKRSTLGNRTKRSALSRTDLEKINENTEADEESLNSPERSKAPNRRERSVLERSRGSLLGTISDRVSAVFKSNKPEETGPRYNDSDEERTKDSEVEHSAPSTPRKSERLSSLRRRSKISVGSLAPEGFTAEEEDEQRGQSDQEEEDAKDEGPRRVDKESKENRNQRVSTTVDDNTRRRISVRESKGPSRGFRKSSIKASGADRKSVSERKSAGAKTQSLLDWFLKGRETGKSSKTLSGNTHASELKRKLDEIKSQTMSSVEARLDEKKRIEKPGTEVSMKKRKPAGNPFARKPIARTVNKAYLVNGRLYKPPRLPRPKEWVTDRLYRFLWKRMEPRYGTSARVRSEKFIVQLSDTMARVEKADKYKQYQARLENLMKEMARLGIVRTRNDFYHFSYDFLPKSLWAKITPMLLPGNQRNVPYDPDTLDQPIVESSS